jgi:hypothetical protein
MQDKRTLHMKVQEQCDCFATSDPLREMAALKNEPDSEEGALKWIALAVLHGINANAKKISIARDNDGSVSVTAKYRKSELPAPSAAVGNRIFDVVKGITHIEEEKGKVPVVIGVRDSSVDLCVRVDQDGKGEEVVLEFAE